MRLAPWLLVVALLGGLGAGHLRAADDLVPVRVLDVKLDEQTGAPLVILTTQKGDRYLVIVVGHAEALAILRELRQHPPMPRPLTHDLLRNVIRGLGARVERVVVTRLVEGTFFADLILRRGKETIRVDARPSDAMALALKVGAKLFVARKVLDEAGISADELEGEKKAPKPRTDLKRAI